jgi:60S ribosomal protein uL30
MSELKQKKVARDAAIAKAAKEASDAAAKEAVELNKAIFEKAKSYEEEYETLSRTAIDNRRNAKANNQIYVPAENQLVFVIRIRGIIGVSPKVKKILQLFRLRQLHNGVFIRINAATLKMLRLVEPFIAYGYPNLKSVKEIIYKRGFGKVSGQRVPISSNTVVSAALGELGMVCIEDVIHEIYTVGPNFKAASNFLWPVKLRSPVGGFRGKKLNHFNEDGACGQQAEKINVLIKKML